MEVFALVVLGVFVAAVAATLICQFRTDYSFVQSVMYLLCWLLTKLLWRVRVVNAIPVAPGEGALIAANHRSSIDPFFIQISARGRFVHWMVAHEYFKLPIIGYFLQQTGAIPTTRAGSDTKATREAIRFAQNGELVGVLPEGKINQTDEFMLPVRPGAATVAIRSGVPIVPCYIEGAPFNKEFWSPFLMRAKVRVEYGQPIPVPEISDETSRRDVARELMLQVVTELARLAKQTDFRPQIR